MSGMITDRVKYSASVSLEETNDNDKKWYGVAKRTIGFILIENPVSGI